MVPDKWEKLKKLGREAYKFVLDKQNTKCLTKTNILHICFNSDDENLIAIDTKGIGYFFEYFSNRWNVRRLGTIGQSTFVTFNPTVKSEILVGQTTTDVKILKISEFSLNQFCILKSHQVPPSWISFYKNYCLTSSRKEAVIWDLRSGGKIHQLRLENNESSLRKSLFSNNGLIASLYENDTIQIWKFDNLETDTRLPLTEYGIRDAKDFIFGENGRCLIVCGGKRNILIFETRSWTLSMKFDLPNGNSVAKRLELLPQTLDSEFRKVLAVLFDDGKIKFLDLSTKKFIEIFDKMLEGVRKFSVSPQGQWIASIEFDGSLTINSINQLIVRPAEITKIKSPKNTQIKISRPKSHQTDQHLQCIREKFKEELRRERLLPILKEFGEYPERYRHLIWKSLLDLPENRQSYLGISEKISDQIELDILKDWNLADKSKKTLLSMTVERLVYLCPFLEQSFFIPELVFPFLIAFQKDPLVGFEASVMILMNFCQKWFEYHPLPPINILGIIENILMEADTELLNYFYRIGVTSTEYAWPLLKTTLSEVLTAKEWLILWDHIFSSGKQSFLIFCVVAYGICSRSTILKVLKNKEDVREFFGNQGQIGVKEVIKMAKKLDQTISKRNHPSRYLRDELDFLPKNGPYPPLLFNEFPKFLVGDHAKISQLQLLKSEEASLKKQRREAAKIAEEKRMREETESFFKEIHNQRLKELQKCYEQQIKLTEMSLANERDRLDKLSLSGNFAESTESLQKNNNQTMNKKKSKDNSCEKMRQNVEMLEEEVQTFLQTLRSSRNTIDN